ncbi:MAG: hypothetical protein Q8P15_01995 [Nanoarchaeota archaeon]|nr:hypothetical protein [Nanoarchaeota archaeon]
MNQRKILEGLLKHLQEMNLGEKIEGEDLHFSIWFYYNGRHFQMEEYNQSSKLNFWLCKKDNIIWYQISSKEKMLEIFSRGKGWEICEGIISQDNPLGNHYLKLYPLTNFSDKFEARIYSTKIVKDQTIMN